MTTPTDIIRGAISNFMNNVHTAMPGIFVSYNPLENKATIQPALNKNYTSGMMPLPILDNVPVLFPPNVFFPINEGDYCLLVFSERALDPWLNAGGQVTPTDPRKFDLSDAIAIPGLMPFNGDFSSNNNQDFVINFAGSNIRIKPNGDIIVETGNRVGIGNSTTEVLDVVSRLMGLLQGLTVMGPAFNGPLDATFIADVALLQAELDAITAVIP